MTIEATACVRLMSIRTRYAALMKSPPTAPGITRLKTLPMNPSKNAGPSGNRGSITRTSANQRKNESEMPAM